MQCISLWQPWASLIAVGAKRFETRTWAPPEQYIGQRIAIHAAKRRPPIDDLAHETKMAINLAIGRHWLDWKDLPRGAFVCTAMLSNAYRVLEVVDTHTLNVVSWAKTPFTITLAEGEEHFGDYAVGRWLWELRHVEEFMKPLPARGRQGFFYDWTPDDIIDPSRRDKAEKPDAARG